MMPKRLLLSCLLCLPALLFAQNVAINADGLPGDASAILDLKSSTKGLLIPRMLAAEKAAIISPAKGLIIYQTNGLEGFYYNAGTHAAPDWVMMGGSATLNGGTPNCLVKWTGTNTVSSSIMKDNGSEMGVNGVPVEGTTLQVYNNSSLGIGLKAVNMAGGTAFYSQAAGSGIAASIDHTGVSGTALSVLSAGAYAATFMGGCVGIGTLTPTAMLQLQDTGSGSGPVHSLVAAANGSSVITMGSIVNKELGRIAYDNSSNRMSFSVNGTQQLTMGLSGLAIGPNFSNPQNLVHLNGGNSPAFVQVTNNASGASTTDGMHFGLGSNGEGYLSYLEPFDFKIQAGSINSFWMNSSGKIGLYGPPDPKFSVLLYNKSNHAAIGLDNEGLTIGDVNEQGTGTYISIPFETNSSIMLMGGNVGIGITPTQPLEVAGNIQVPAVADYRYSTAKTHYYSVAAVIFTPENTAGFEKGSSNGSIYASGGNTDDTAYFVAPVNLPDSAIVTSISFYEVDHDVNYNLQPGQFCRNDASTMTSYGNTIICATVNAPSGSNSDIKAMTSSIITNPVIDNQNYTYYLRWGTQQNNPNLRLAKVLISYTVMKAD